MMLKKLIPAAALLALAGAAQAQVSVYGLIDLSYGKNEMANNRAATIHSGADDGGAQGNSVTRVGVKGSAELAPGIKGNFKLETGGIDLDGQVNGGGNFFSRQAWAGVSGGFGEVRVGRDDDVIFQTYIGFDLNGGANMASAAGNAGVSILGQGRVSRQIQYISPSMSGFTVHLAHAPEDTTTNANGKAFSSVALKYAVGGLNLALANEGKRTTTDEGNTLYAASYDFGVAKLAVMKSGTNGSKGTQYGVSAPVAGFTVGAQFAKNSTNGNKATEVFVNKEVFKNTVAYLDLGRRNPRAGASTSGYALGVIYVF